MQATEKLGIAGTGALGGIVARAVMGGQKGLERYTLHAISDKKDQPAIPCPNVDFETLCAECDIIVECLPADQVPHLVNAAMKHGKTLVMISACALILSPEIYDMARTGHGRIIVPSGALSGLDAVAALSTQHITEAKIISTKPPKGFAGAPYIKENGIDVEAIREKFMVFSGNVMEAARAFPANVNVAASLALAGIGPQKTMVEVWADPDIKGNAHEIIVKGPHSVIRSRIENMPDPSNPKSSMQAGYSIVSALMKRHAHLTIF